MKLPISDIQVCKRHRKQMGDIAELAASIDLLGLLHPVVVDGDYRLLAGERRLKACEKLGWKEVPVTVVKNLTELAEKLRAEQHENTCRLDFAPSEAVALGEKIEKLEKPKAEEREKAGRKPSGNLPQGKTRDIVGRAVGLSGKTYETAKKIVQAAKANPDLLPIVERMDKTGNVSKAAREIKRVEIQTKLEAVRAAKPNGQEITGPFDLILADPRVRLRRRRLFRVRCGGGRFRRWRGRPWRWVFRVSTQHTARGKGRPDVAELFESLLWRTVA